MCGIAGIFSFKKPVELSNLKRMTDVLAHRGPDGEGHWINENKMIGLGHRRLSIIDLSDSASQPMHSNDSRYSISYNGEIYNYIEIKEELIAKGYTFKTSSDTEVLLSAYQEYNKSMLEKLDGMFSFAIWDNVEEELFCARDRFGEKPFYYHYERNNQFTFASEMKGLFSIGISKSINNKMLFNYLVYDVVENAFDKTETFYNNIFKLEPSHYLVVKENGELSRFKYWDVDINNINRSMSIEAATETFRNLFETSIKRRLRSDVPVGSSLSGGIDSSSIVSIINRKLESPNETQKTFSARFKDKNYDEGNFLEILKNKFKYKAYYTYPDASTLINEIDKVYYHQEEPFGTASIIAQWEVMKLARNNGITVLLDGQGADEVMGGYHKYFDAYLRELYKSDKVRFVHEKTKILKLHGKTYNENLRFKAETYCPKLLRTAGSIKRLIKKEPLSNNLNSEFTRLYRKNTPPFLSFNSLNKTLYFDTFIYGLEKLLRFSDRNSMAFSREVRLPFLSHELVEFVFSLPPEYKIYNGWTKYILRKSMEEILPKKTTWRVDKMGYQAPQENWCSDKLIAELIHSSKHILEKNEILNKNANFDTWKILMAAKLFEK